MNTLIEKAFVALQYCVPQHGLSRLVGWLARSEIPWIKTRFIHTFIRRFKVDLSEACIEDPDRFDNFNAFFTRALKDDARPIAEGDATLACPADGTVSQRGPLRGSDLLQAKGHYYSLFQLLGGDGTLAAEFSNGQFATVYLSPSDYHRVHMPCTGTLRETVYVPGRLFSVNQATTERVPGLFARNERLVCVFDTERGPMAVILVGAMIVAGIETVFAGQVTPQPGEVTRRQYRDPQPVVLEKGAELGRFLLGSTVIVLFPEGAADLDTAAAPGAKVRMGEAFGHYV
ncbi:archaetidylserine decarboxylase [Alloalcanivorax marinus]|uniref:archaetidylserine decarboxylase n=1 Tax=Alloalcanivorax marinus TaxID=1177169 RepID=UPI001958017E|nr:archaetidylserine decarboxylase [Alloalcanivorax marinus]MBM7332960.1 phosphatidylserine decarboxylase [Alloalcanivorax marinus]